MQIGDYVTVIDGTELDNGEVAKNWAGQITALEGELFSFQKDAQTLDSLSDDYIKYGLENGLDPLSYIFEENVLELSDRRDTDDMYKAAVNRFYLRQDSLDDDMYVEQLEAMSDEDFKAQFGGEEIVREDYLKAMEIMTQQFLKSPFAEHIADIEQENIEFIIDMFVRYAKDYQGEMLKDWTKSTVDEICLDILPRKVHTEPENFKVTGKILKYYFDFLAAEKFIRNTQLGDYVYSIREEIYNNSQNPNYWGMAKSMLKGAVDQGVDMDNTDALNAYMKSQMFKPRPLPNVPKSRTNYLQTPAKQDPFKKIGRNQKVTVKYKNGKVVKDVKFKKVMKDVKSGKCKLV